jgi:hypothetical protein
MSIFTADALLEQRCDTSRQKHVGQNMTSSFHQVTASDTGMLSMDSEETAVTSFSPSPVVAAYGRCGDGAAATVPVRALQGTGVTPGVTLVTPSDKCSSPHLWETSSSNITGLWGSPGPARSALTNSLPNNPADALSGAAPTAAAEDEGTITIQNTAAAAAGLAIAAPAAVTQQGDLQQPAVLLNPITAAGATKEVAPLPPPSAAAGAAAPAATAAGGGRQQELLEQPRAFPFAGVPAVDEFDADEVLRELCAWEVCNDLDWDGALTLVEEALEHVTGVSE